MKRNDDRALPHDASDGGTPEADVGEVTLRHVVES